MKLPLVDEIMLVLIWVAFSYAAVTMLDLLMAPSKLRLALTFTLGSLLGYGLMYCRCRFSVEDEEPKE
jgi:hypothetical protein